MIKLPCRLVICSIRQKILILVITVSHVVTIVETATETSWSHLWEGVAPSLNGIAIVLRINQ